MAKIKKFNIDTNIPASSSVKGFSITGDPGAAFIMQVLNEDGYFYNFSSKAFQTGTALLNKTINSSGVYTDSITFPTVTDDDHYDVTIFANASYETEFDTNAFTNKYVYNAPRIYQYIDTTITFTSLHSSAAMVEDTAVTSTASRNTPLKKFSISWDFTLSSSQFVPTRQPLLSDFETTTTDTVDGAISSATSVVLDSVAGLGLGMKITGVSGGSLSGTPTITNIDVANKKITFSSSQTFGDGITLTFTGYGSNGTEAIYGTSFKVNKFKLTTNDVTTTVNDTDANGSDSITTVTLTSGNGIKVETTQTVDGAKGTATDIVLDAITNLWVGQTLIAISSGTLIGQPTITKIDSSTKTITLSSAQTVGDGITLTFANSIVSGINVNTTCSGVKPYVDTHDGSNTIVISSGQVLENGQPLTFSGSSRAGSITADVEVTNFGATNFTTTLNLDNFINIG